MAAVIVTILCIAMIVMGGVILSQGMLTSADATALSVEDITVREGELTRTSLEAVRAAWLDWADLLRVTVRNNGQTRLAGFERWDFIVDYTDNAGGRHSISLPCADNQTIADRWQPARLGLNGPVEFFEPDVLNPEEELVILAGLEPPPGDGAEASVTIAAVNGVHTSISFEDPGYTLLVPHADNTTIAVASYYQLEEDAAADAPGTVMAAAFGESETGRKILVNEELPSREARHIFPLLGIENIPAALWTFYYDCQTSGGGDFPQAGDDVGFDVDIIVRQADGTVRQTIASGVAVAFIPYASRGSRVTISGTFSFPVYEVVDPDDYLEIVYYGRVEGMGPGEGTGYVLLHVDDSSQPLTGQTRIES